MSETPVDPASEQDTDQDTEASQLKFEQYPADHPLVKRLETLKTELKEAKPKLRRLTELEEATKSDAEKAADRISKAEAEAASVPAKVAEALRTHLVALHDIDPEDAELFLTATDPDLMLKQVTRLLGQDKRRKNHVPREGQTPVTAAGETSDMREFTHQLFGRE